MVRKQPSYLSSLKTASAPDLIPVSNPYTYISLLEQIIQHASHADSFRRWVNVTILEWCQIRADTSPIKYLHQRHSPGQLQAGVIQHNPRKKESAFQLWNWYG
jgi:hypothetical protein